MRKILRFCSYIVLFVIASGIVSYAQEMMVDRIVAIVGDEIILLSGCPAKVAAGNDEPSI